MYTFIMGSAASTPKVTMSKVTYVPPFTIERSLFPKLWGEVDAEVAYCAWEFRTILKARRDLDDYSKVAAEDSCIRLILEKMIENQSNQVRKLRDLTAPELDPSEDLKFQFRWESDKLTCFRIWKEWAWSL